MSQECSSLLNDDDGKEWETTEMFTDFEILTARFHFIDLADSEQLKCTGVTGQAWADGVKRFNMFHENSMLHTEHKNLRMRVKALQQTVDAITVKNITFLAEHNTVTIASAETASCLQDGLQLSLLCCLWLFKRYL
ncbi:hypothetical protein LSAT2_002733 [Lamellibrachia satsuma]|nr:hypothetical protein LSAT2_002733 [Lamellibrachia satsuma]